MSYGNFSHTCFNLFMYSAFSKKKELNQLILVLYKLVFTVLFIDCIYATFNITICSLFLNVSIFIIRYSYHLILNPPSTVYNYYHQGKLQTNFKIVFMGLACCHLQVKYVRKAEPTKEAFVFQSLTMLIST